MIISLLNENKKSIAATDIFKNVTENDDFIEIRCDVNIIHFSSKLLSLDKTMQRRFIEDMYFLSNLKGWYYEYYRTILRKKTRAEHPELLYNIDHELKETTNQIKNFYNDIAVKYGLTIKTD